MDELKRNVSFQIPEDKYWEIKEICKLQGISMADFYRFALYTYLHEYRNNYNRTSGIDLL